VPTFSLLLEADLAAADEIAADLFELGASGVEVRDGEEQPMPGARQPPPGRALLVAWFQEEAEAGEAARCLGGELSVVADEDWSEGWKRDFRPLDVGRVRVRPSWIAEPPPPGSVEIVLDPGMAFGTGNHPTTSLCLGALSDLLGERPGARVLDVGTGSGLLAIAARKLGAGRVAANDNDPVAVAVARENALANGAEVEIVGDPIERIGGEFDVVVANILANTLVEIAPRIAERLAPRGVVLLSGILAPQAGEVRDAYAALGLAQRPGREEGEWVLLALERAS